MTTPVKLTLALALLCGCLTTLPAESQAGLRHGCCAPPPPPPQNIVLAVCHPCTGCNINVPVCVPACCTGVPHACFQGTCFGCGKTVFTWDCGYCVAIRYTKHGGYRVVSR